MISNLTAAALLFVAIVAIAVLVALAFFALVARSIMRRRNESYEDFRRRGGR